MYFLAKPSASRLPVFLCLVGILVFFGCRQKENTFYSDHFTIQTLANGVYAAIHIPGGEAICNAGIINLGEETLIFDCFLTPKAAMDLKRAAEELTGNPVTYVVNSHYHNDHIRGNQVFDKETIIISTERIRQLIEQHEPEEIESEKGYAPAWLADLQKEYGQTEDSARKKELIMWIGYVQGMLDSHPILETVLPDSIFMHELIIKGSKQDIKLVEYSNAHTENDIILIIENEKILFTGDLLFVGCHPYLAHGDPFHLIQILEELKQLNADCIVPGHGEVGDNSDIEQLISYIEQLKKVSTHYLSVNKTTKDITDTDIPPDFKHWQFPNFFKYNLGYMLEPKVVHSNE